MGYSQQICSSVISFNHVAAAPIQIKTSSRADSGRLAPSTPLCVNSFNLQVAYGSFVKIVHTTCRHVVSAHARWLGALPGSSWQRPTKTSSVPPAFIGHSTSLQAHRIKVTRALASFMSWAYNIFVFAGRSPEIASERRTKTGAWATDLPPSGRFSSSTCGILSHRGKGAEECNENPSAKCLQNADPKATPAVQTKSPSAVNPRKSSFTWPFVGSLHWNFVANQTLCSFRFRFSNLGAKNNTCLTVCFWWNLLFRYHMALNDTLVSSDRSATSTIHSTSGIALQYNIQ